MWGVYTSNTAKDGGGEILNAKILLPLCITRDRVVRSGRNGGNLLCAITGSFGLVWRTGGGGGGKGSFRGYMWGSK